MAAEAAEAVAGEGAGDCSGRRLLRRKLEKGGDSPLCKRGVGGIEGIAWPLYRLIRNGGIKMSARIGRKEFISRILVFGWAVFCLLFLNPFWSVG